MRYCDSSFVAPLLLTEATSEAVEDFIAELGPGGATISEWTLLEIAGVLARQVRIQAMRPISADRAIARLNDLAEASFNVVAPEPADYRLARDYLRQYETGLRGGDALHLAIAANRRAEAIYTLDQGMLKAGRKLGLPVASGIRLPR